MPLFSKPLSTNPTDLVWIQTSFLGDIILTTAAMTRAQQLLPSVKQHLITTNIGKAALGKEPHLHSVHVFDKSGGIAAIRQTSRAVRPLLGKSPVMLQPHKSFRSSLLAKAIGAPTITYKETSLAFLAYGRVPRVPVLHETDRISLLLTGLGFSREQVLGGKPQLTALPLAKEGPLAALATDRTWIGIAPGSVWGTKCWPLAKFTTLTQRLIDDPSVGVVLIGGGNEQMLCNQIQEHTLRTRPHVESRLLNLSGRTSLDDLRRLFPKLNLVVSNDSSPIHYASAFDIPTVAIFGATVPAFGFTPLAKQSQIVEVKDLPCRPCGDHGPQTCPLAHFKCMNQIEVEAVYQACQSVLQTIPT